MASMIKKGEEVVIGLIMIAIAGGVLLTLNQAAVGGALNWFIVGLVPLGLGISLLIHAFGHK